MTGSKARTQPSHYPPLAFHLTRTTSFISSIIVTAILLYFCYHLRRDHYKLPWTFLILLAVSLLTLIAFVITSLIHVCHTLSPRLSLLINIPLLLLWLIGVGLLGWNMYGTLGHTCDTATWGNETGVMICRTYKALFSFAVFGCMAAIASVVLDFIARREQLRQGSYDKMRDPLTKDAPSEGDFKFEAGMNNVTDIAMEPYRNQGPEPGYQDVQRRTPRQDYDMQHFGYNAPSEQTRYEAGSYGYGDRN